jgi:hypothetical protein
MDYSILVRVLATFADVRAAFYALHNHATMLPLSVAHTIGCASTHAAAACRNSRALRMMADACLTGHFPI